ncbi:Uncharacterized protein DBV15_09066, partial [Temnothorax longispinosus]
IVRNKAAEKAKHAHQQQQAQQQQGQQQGQPGSGGSVSVIAHAPATVAGHPAATAPNAYSISGILGIPAHHQDPNGNSIKRKRSVDDDNRELNDHAENDLKRQRNNYNGDQLYSNIKLKSQATESSTVAVSYVGVGAGGGEQSPPISLQNETNATPAAPNTPGGDPGLTVLQPPVSQPQVASAIPPYSTMLPSFGHYATGGGDYAYSAAYSQYSSAPYSGYGYGAATSGLLNSTYYYCNGDTTTHTSQQGGGGCTSGAPESSADVASRSPLAATRASSGASAASPTGSACTKPDHTSATPTDLYLA